MRMKFLAGAALLMATAALAQNQTDYSKVEIKTTKLNDKFYTLEGQGGMIGALVGPDGVFLVDTQFAPLTEKIVAAVKKISPSPIKFIVDTHVHGDHTGGNENFAKLGAVLFSRDQLRARLARPAGNAAPSPAVGSRLRTRRKWRRYAPRLQPWRIAIEGTLGLIPRAANMPAIARRQIAGRRGDRRLAKALVFGMCAASSAGKAGSSRRSRTHSWIGVSRCR